MTAEVLDLWDRALRSHKTAALLETEDPDAAASRAYYAAFHAVSALFAHQGVTFAKHSGAEAAVHRDLVKTGKWSADLGAAYSWLSGLRITGDYGGGLHVRAVDAQQAVVKADEIIQAVRRTCPDPLP